MILDADLLRRRRVELRLSIRQLAENVGVTSPVIRAMEAGDNHKDLAVGFIERVADSLGLDPATLWATDNDTEGAPGDDAATVGAVLHATGVLTPTVTIAEILDWSLDRVDTALDDLAVALAAAGLRLHRLKRSVSIERAVEAADRDVIRRAVRAHLNEDSLNLTEAKVLTRIATGTLTKELSNPDKVALGVLSNAELVQPIEGTGAAWELADDVAFSLMLDHATG